MHRGSGANPNPESGSPSLIAGCRIGFTARGHAGDGWVNPRARVNPRTSSAINPLSLSFFLPG